MTAWPDPALPDESDITWVPVRHHSPAAARAVAELIRRLRPAAVLIEGPSDVTDLSVLRLGHRLPIALMSWVRQEDAAGVDASYSLYPLTSFSAEWQAIDLGLAQSARVEFIDLPWRQVRELREGGTREVDAAPALLELQPDRSFYESLADYSGRSDLSSVWDEFFEIDPTLSAAEYLRRAAILGAGLRLSSGVDGLRPDPEIEARERHMTQRIRAIRAELSGPILVVTGAFHTAGLQRLLAEPAVLDAEPATPSVTAEHGWALIPTSYELLDANAGYLAGQPDPGFYEQVFTDTSAEVVPQLLHHALSRLRKAKVPVSTADSIAALTTAQALQQIRGHARLWRDDLVEAVASVLVKDSIEDDHPLLRAVHRELRGEQVGQLAPGTPLPQLVSAVHDRFTHLGLELSLEPRVVRAELKEPRGRELSQLLHGLVVLGVPGLKLVEDITSGDPADLNSRSVVRTQQTWQVRWLEAGDAALILAARWGPTVAAAVTAKLAAQANRAGVEEVAALVLSSARCGVGELSARLLTALEQALTTSVELPGLARVLQVLVRLFHFDGWLGTIGRDDLARLIQIVHERCIRAVERLGNPPAGIAVTPIVDALRVLAEASLTLDGRLEIDPAELMRALGEQLSQEQTPELRGALVGADWLLRGDPEHVPQASLGDPAGTGQFYAGLLRVARHLALASPQLFDIADLALRTWSEAEFLAALPELRRALAGLNTAEQRALIQHLGGLGRALPRLRVDEPTLLALAAREAELWAEAEHWMGGLGR